MLYDLAAAAEGAGLMVRKIGFDATGSLDLPALIGLAGGAQVAFRSADGPLAAALGARAPIRLVGATAQWFALLPIDVTGRSWVLTDVDGAEALLIGGPAFVKLAEAKHRALPARRYATVSQLRDALNLVHAPATLQLLVTTEWLEIDSEYRVFTIGRRVVAYAPYLVEGELWTPLLHTHRASFHDEAATFVQEVLSGLAADRVPPTAVMDVARLCGGRFVLLEVNHAWAAGLYGCEPRAALQAVLAAADGETTDGAGQWLWRPDPAVGQLSRSASRAGPPTSLN